MLKIRVSTGGISVKDITNRFLGAMNLLPSDASRNIKQLMDDMATELISEPPLAPGNSPPFPIWQRGVGRVFASGKVNPKSARYGGNQSTWEKKVVQTTRGATGEMTTRVPYAPYLIDDALQAPWHSGRWQTVKEVGRKVGADEVVIQSQQGKMYEPILNFIKRLKS